jgi:hypothetical protein
MSVNIYETITAGSYLAATDLRNREVEVVIESVAVEEIGQERQRKPVVHLAGKQKAWVLNKVNATRLAEAYGPETDAWTGRKVILFAEQVQGPSGIVPGIRCRIPQQPAQQQPAQVGGFDDDIPW